MEKQRQIKILSIIALVLAITGMTLGFAAFSTTLNISSSASVSPSGDGFNVRFCESRILGACANGSVGGILIDTTGGGIGNDFAAINGLSTDNLDVGFDMPGQSVSYHFFVHNVGEYDAYLTGITYNSLDNGNYKKCRVSTGSSVPATDSLVQAACEGIKVNITVGSVNYGAGNGNISGHLLAKGEVQDVFFNVSYVDGSPYADGDFYVDIADFKFNYSSVDEGNNLISLVVDDVSYQAEEGMTWEEWVNSGYNTGNYYIDEFSRITLGDSKYVMSTDDHMPVKSSSVIIDSFAYYYGAHGGGSND